MDTSKTRHSLFHSFCIRPNLRFANQYDDESIILVLRAHPFTQLGWLINSLFFVILLVSLDIFLRGVLSLSQFIFLNFFGVGLILGYMWFNFLSWFFNVGIITDRRIIDIDFSSIIYNEVSEVWLTKIQDITQRTGGFIKSFFNYGNVFVQTSGTEQNIEFMDVPNPATTVRIINELNQK